jgi:Uma2 family endonuclease
MATLPISDELGWTAADVLKQFGAIPLRRIRQEPPPGSATEQDVIDIQVREGRLYELVDGVLVEKGMGLNESILACYLIQLLGNFVRPRKLGIVAGEGGMMRLAPGLIRIPDVSYISWNRFPNRRIPKKPAPDLAPDLAIEILSKGNTKKEMERKRRDYFLAGVEVVWEVDPEKRTVKVYTAPDTFKLFRHNQVVSGAPVLPEFSISLKEFFAEVGEV